MQIWENPFVEKTFQELCKADFRQWKAIEDRQMQTYVLYNKNNRLILSYAAGIWEMKSPSHQFEHIGHYHSPPHLTPKDLLEQVESMFDPSRQHILQSFISYLQLLGIKTTGTFTHATVFRNRTSLDGLITFWKNEQKIECLSIPFAQYQHIKHLLSTTAHATPAGKIGMVEGLIIRAPRSAHETLKLQKAMIDEPDSFEPIDHII